MAFSYTSPQSDRRKVLCNGGALAFTGIVSSLLVGGKTVLAAPLAGDALEVDEVAVRIVIDSYQIAVAPDLNVDNVEINRFGFALGNHPPGKALLSEFGLSMLGTAKRGAQTSNVLVDFGYTPQSLLNNLELLGIKASQLDALVLSHGHYDHFGGLAGFLAANREGLKPGLPIYLGGEECFCARSWLAPPMKGDFGALDRDALEQAKLSIMFAPGPSVVGGLGFTTGRIDLTSFEKVLSPSAMKIGRTGNFGCYPVEFTPAEREKETIPDQFRHEIGTAYNLRGRGLVVLTSCSHRGVVNIVRQAQAASGVQKVHAVIGGFHLAPQKEDYVRQTIRALGEINPDFVIPLHCSGEPFYEIMKSEMPTKLLRGYTGTQFVFHA